MRGMVGELIGAQFFLGGLASGSKRPERRTSTIAKDDHRAGRTGRDRSGGLETITQ
jgi:hypothetical protein